MNIRTRAIGWVLAVSFSIVGCAEETQAPSKQPALSDEELTSTLVELFQERDRIERAQRLLPILENVTEDQGDALRLALDEVRKASREFDRVLIISTWAKFDPQASTQWIIRNVREGVVREAMLKDSVYQWALKDPEGLVRDPSMGVYARGGWDPSTLRALVEGWYDSGNPNLEQFIYELTNVGDDRQRAISALIAAKLQNEGADTLIEWVEASKRGHLAFDRYVHSRAAGDIARVDPERAIAWCNEICDTPLGEEMPLWIATTWVLEDGDAAMNWIIQGDAEEESVRLGARAGFRRYLLFGREDAFAWMENTSEEHRRELATMQGPLFMYINERSGLGFHEMAIEWTTKYLTGEAEREEMLTTIARRWLNQDPEAAEEWLADAPMSDDAKYQAHQPRRRMTTGGSPKFGERETILR